MSDDWGAMDSSGRPLRPPPVPPPASGGRPPLPPLTPAGLRRAVLDRIALADGDPERGHADLDEITERTLRAIADGDPDARSMARLAVELLDREAAEGWRRWYA